MAKTAAVTLEAAIVARRFYIDGQQKNDIANDLGISRFKVARLLDEARESGIVKITVSMPTDLDVPLGEQIAKAFGLSKAIVVKCTSSAPGVVMPLICTAAADYLTSFVQKSDVIGVSWGRTLEGVFDVIDDIAGAEVVQLVGDLPNQAIEIGGVELARRLSGKTGGKVYPLHSPMLVGTAELAKQLKAEPGLKMTIDRFKKITIAVVGIGSWSPPKSALYESLKPADIELLQKKKAVGDICASVVNAKGELISGDIANRIVAITTDELQNIPDVVAIAGSQEKSAAISAVLKAGLVNTLITDSVTATAMLKALKK